MRMIYVHNADQRPHGNYCDDDNAADDDDGGGGADGEDVLMMVDGGADGDVEDLMWALRRLATERPAPLLLPPGSRDCLTWGREPKIVL